MKAHFALRDKVWHPYVMPVHRRTLKRIEQRGDVRYLTCSCYQRLPLFANDRIKDAFVQQLTLARRRLNFLLYAWVVMPEHFHLLIMPCLPEVTVTRVLHAIKRPFATMVLARWRELDASVLNRVRDAQGREHFWQRGGGYDRNIFSDVELLEKVNYIHANPIRRKLCAAPVDWRWSSAQWYENGTYDGPQIDPLPT